MNTPYETTDIGLAAYLFVQKYKITEIRKLGTKGTFVFEPVDEQVITDYLIGNSSVEPIAFHQAIRQLTTAVRRQ